MKNRLFAKTTCIVLIVASCHVRAKGFEHVPFYKREQKPYTGFIFGVTGGAEEILRVGK